MTAIENNEPISLRETARGVAIRAGFLTVGGILIGGWIVGMSMKIAGKAIHILLLAGAGLVALFSLSRAISAGSSVQQRSRQP